MAMGESMIRGPAEPDAGPVQGILLACIPTLLVITIVVAIPIIPTMLHVYCDVPDVAVLIPAVVVLPTLALALAGGISGLIGERIGYRTMLNLSAALFAVTAVLPFWITPLGWMLGARAATGIALGLMTTAGSVLTGRYFSGTTRQRWIAVQSAAAAAAGVLSALVSGMLAQWNWQAPFLLLAVGCPFWLALMLLPARKMAQATDRAAASDGNRAIPWEVLVPTLLLSIPACLLTFPPSYMLGVVLQEQKLGASMIAGIASACVAGGAVAGAFGQGTSLPRAVVLKTCVALCLGGAGALAVATSGSLAAFLIGATVVGVAQGMVYPALLADVLERSPVAAMGRVIALFTMTFYLLQFAAPLIGGWMASQSATAALSVFHYGLVSISLAACLGAFHLVHIRIGRRSHTRQTNG